MIVLLIFRSLWLIYCRSVCNLGRPAAQLSISSNQSSQTLVVFNLNSETSDGKLHFIPRKFVNTYYLLHTFLCCALIAEEEESNKH